MSRTLRRTVAVGAVALVALGASCGGAQDGPLARAENRLDDIRSGRMALTVEARAGGADAPASGFSVAGDFALSDRKDRLPVADLTVKDLAAPRAERRFVSTGSEVFVAGGGAPQRVPDATAARFRGRAEGGAVQDLDLTEWVDEPVVAPAGSAGDVPLERITGTADPVRALNDVFGLISSVGAAGGERSLREIEGDDADRLRRAVRSSTAEMLVGKKDGLLRGLRLDVEFGVDDEEMRRILGALAGARLRVDLQLSRINLPVRVEPPR